MDDLLTTNQVRNLLQVDRTTIYRMVESGQLPAIRVGKQWRFARPEIEHWLRSQTVTTTAMPTTNSSTQGAAPANSSVAQRPAASAALAELLPLGCSQLIQDAFAEILGVMMVIADMQGQPVTKVSNACGFYTALTQDPDAVAQCVHTWQHMAASPSMEPRFHTSEMGLLCARGLIRVGSEIKGMVVIGGIAPEVWPPAADQLASLAALYHLSTNYVKANADAVYRLDKLAQEKALHSVQRIADIFSHIAEDRNELGGRLQAIASLTAL